MKTILATGLVLVLIAGCSIKPQDDDLGAEVSIDDINNALIAAQSGVTQDQAFHVGDWGKVQITQNILSYTYIAETHERTVKEINNDYIIFEDDTYGKNPVLYEIPREKHTASVPRPHSSKNIFAKLWTSVSTKIAKIFKSVSVEPSTAMGQAAMNNQGKKIISKIGGIEVLTLPPPQVRMADVSPTPSPTPASTATPTPTPSPSPSPTVAPSRYYGLSAEKHLLTTTNCGQIPNCKVNATRIEYNEMKPENDSVTRIHWLWEISTEVPGLFTLQQQCYSQIVKKGDSQIPLATCLSVTDFKFGSQ